MENDDMTEKHEQADRELLERIGIEGAQSFTAGDLVELANLIAASKKATPAQEWEPLTPERLERLQQEPTGTRYWLACKQFEPSPIIGAKAGPNGRTYFSCVDDGYFPEEISHIMPFTTPEMPKA